MLDENQIEPRKVCIVILNWNTWHDTIECLKSINAMDYSNIDIVIVDNGSTNDSIKHIEAWGLENSLSVFIENDDVDISGGNPKWSRPKTKQHLVILKSRENVGFAKGNNIGSRYALSHDADYILLLNNDTIVSKDCLRKLVHCAESHSKVGCVWPKVLKEDGSIQIYPEKLQENFLDIIKGIHIVSVISNLFSIKRCKEQPFSEKWPEKPIEVPGTAGCCLLLKTELIYQIGLLDENTFLYGEERILSKRIERSDMSIWLEPSATIIHKGKKSIVAIPPAKFWTYCVQSELHFTKAYLNCNIVQILFLKSLRCFSFFIKCFMSRDYRMNIGHFISNYIFWRSKDSGEAQFLSRNPKT